MSGKRAKSFRKKYSLSKKALALCAGFFLSCAPLAAENEFLVSAFVPVTKPFGPVVEMKYGFGGLRLTYRTAKVINIFAQGEYLSMAMPAGVEPITLWDASLGAGYHFILTDRSSIDLNAFGGIYSAQTTINGDNRTVPGFTAGLSLGFGGYFIFQAFHGEPINIFGNPINLTIGKLVEFISYFDLLIWPLIALGQIVTMKSRAKTSLRRITRFLDSEEDVKSPEGALTFKDVKGEITFKNLTFKYENESEPALKNVSFTIKPGETIGVVGKIGSGKSSLATLLLRLYNFDEGCVFVDGVDLMKADITSLRENIAYAPQDNFLFSDTISNNIAFSSEEANQKKVEEAAHFADIDNNIEESFPNKYETVSGERGITLSGGQKQRISLARAYYKHAPIMIMDDTVSAVDMKTEENILHNVTELRKGQTTIVIASRVSTVRKMDRILVMKDGMVDAFDTHENLMKNCQTYQKLVYLQQLEAEVKGGNAND